MKLARLLNAAGGARTSSIRKDLRAAYSGILSCLCLLAAAAMLTLTPVAAQETPPPQAEESQPDTNEADTASSEQMQAAEESEPDAASAENSERNERRYRRPAIVEFGRDAELGTNDSTEAMVVIGGSATVRGRIQDAVVAIGGNITLKDGADVSEAVAVLGGIKAEKGSRIRGEAVAVGGRVEVEEGATVEGQVQDVPIASFGLPKPEWLQKWFRYCVLGFRPLAPQVGWVWGVAGVWFLFYLLVAAAFPRPVKSCVDELQRRPATTFAIGILTLILLPLVFLLLAVTGVGLLVVPFLLAAVALAGIVGKVGFLEWLGFSIGRPFRSPALENPLIALLAGSVILVLFYMVPVLGLLLLLVTGVWGLGAAVGAAFGGMRREMPAQPLAPPPQPGYPMAGAGYGTYGGPAQSFAPPGAMPPAPSAGHPGEPEIIGVGASSVHASTATSVPPGFIPPILPETLAYPRAGFWERMGAGFLDIVLVIILGAIVGNFPLTLIIALAYFAGMWGWRATSIGGIVLGLKVVRTDGSPVTFAVALVRGLAAAFSIIVLFLGILWIAWDKEKQGWHDRIAGTVVIKLPHGTPLVCF